MYGSKTCPSMRSESQCAERPCLLVRMGVPVGSMDIEMFGLAVGLTDVLGILGSGRGNDATGDAVTGVAGGIGLHVVGLLVDDDGGTAIGNDAVG
jgi:hypothetical protein